MVIAVKTENLIIAGTISAVRALIIGRFQPFHLGHVHLAEHAQEYELIFAIGSAYQSLSFENPFTAGERYEMIDRALGELDVKKYFIVPVPDIRRHGVYGKHVADLTPSFDVVISNNAVVKEIFERDGYEVKGAPLFHREKYQGKVIRKRMAEGKEWENLVPESVASFIRDIGGEIRVRNLSHF